MTRLSVSKTFGKSSGSKGVYTLTFLGKAVQDLKRVDLPFPKIIKEKLLILAENPDLLKNNITRLSGTGEDYFRLRAGSYRVVFQRKQNELVMLVIRFGRRREVYRDW